MHEHRVARTLARRAVAARAAASRCVRTESASGMVRQGGVRQVRTPVFLRLGEWRSTVQVYLPYQPRRDAPVPASNQCADAACAAADGDAEWIAVPLSAQAEFSFAAQIKV
eukprot:COSAG02_NODE_35150_length_473_cov_0.652406_1_plen_110_part_10